MGKFYNLQRFLDAQDKKNTYKDAVNELRNGAKQGHWIWFILPQLKGLGNSPESQYYGIDGLDEAKAYLENTRLKSRLTHTIAIISAQLDINGNNLELLMGSQIDALKTISSLTLFVQADLQEAIALQLTLNKFCQKTLDLLIIDIPERDSDSFTHND